MYVGMNRVLPRSIPAPGSVPHVRGDEPLMSDIRKGVYKRSPCTWG